MNPLKKQLMDTAKALPDDATLEDVIQELIFKAKVMEGVRQLDAGEGISHAEMKKRVSKWLSR